MTTQSPADEAQPLVRVETAGDLFTAVYGRLKAMAANRLARAPHSGTLDTTGLVHDLYLRLRQTGTRQTGTGTICERNRAATIGPRMDAPGQALGSSVERDRYWDTYSAS